MNTLSILLWICYSFYPTFSVGLLGLVQWKACSNPLFKSQSNYLNRCCYLVIAVLADLFGNCNNWRNHEGNAWIFLVYAAWSWIPYWFVIKFRDVQSNATSLLHADWTAGVMSSHPTRPFCNPPDTSSWTSTRVGHIHMSFKLKPGI